jgi:hypothetical protein
MVLKQPENKKTENSFKKKKGRDSPTGQAQEGPVGSPFRSHLSHQWKP